MHRAFHAERRLVERNMCPCESCTQTSDLKLKFVAHVGDVATQTIKRRRKLVGMDVIFVHRLLKNPVQVPEYVLLSEDALRRRAPPPPTSRSTRSRRTSRASGRCALLLGRRGPRRPAPSRARPLPARRLGATFGMVGRGLPYVLRLRRPAAAAAADASAARAPRRRSASASSLVVTTSSPAAALAG